MSGGHTEGPWCPRFYEAADAWHIHTRDGGWVATVDIDGTPDGAAADARLIAAAPDLLEALQDIVDYRGGAENALVDEYVLSRVEAAIAKATGGPDQ